LIILLFEATPFFQAQRDRSNGHAAKLHKQVRRTADVVT
jgi:hypothetical protein